jgi:hypothetical protein
MNLVSAILVHLWIAGWALAALRAGLQARAVRVPAPPGASR